VDPNYALAWAGIADCHGQMRQWNVMTDPGESTRLGLAAATRAIELNPRLPDAHKAQALLLRSIGEMDKARQALLRALECNPRFVPALINLSVDEFSRANLAGAERLNRRVLEIDPQEQFAMAWLGFLMTLLGRFDDAEDLSRRQIALATTPFYKTAVYAQAVWAALGRGDVAAAARAVHDGIAGGAMEENMRCCEALVVVREGRTDEARRLVADLSGRPSLATGVLPLVAACAVRLGDIEAARAFMSRKVLDDIAPVIVRLVHELHPLLDRNPFAPRRSPLTLVWPLEAPMIDVARHALFKGVRIESGYPRGSDVFGSEVSGG
jgi:tetratricopeptide (TPR) repeat protein